MGSQIYFRFFSIVSIMALMAACQGSKHSSEPSAPALPPYCGTVTTYQDNSVVISGQAAYQFRESDNGTVAPSPRPIREAEMRVINSQGATVQCGRTNSAGLFSLTLPRSTEQFFVYVNSRSDHELLKAYVMTDPNSKSYYSVSLNFVPDASKDIGQLLAPATGSLEGGAFNILDQLLNANQFLTAQTSSCKLVVGSCVPFTVNSTILTRVYWKKGLNPAAAYYNAFSAVSFYLPGKHELYILGGENGDVDNTDTDHFDNSVIIHEYAHYIEDLFIKSDSPGGTHNGNTIIDPRLAWSEGFANFFQAAVTGIPHYHDTVGTSDGWFHDGYSEYIATYNSHSPTRDVASVMGEGNFREFSISRALWQITQNTSSFNELWAFVADVNVGLKNTLFSFRAVGLLFESQSSINYTNWSSALTSEKHLPNRKDFANPLRVATGCSLVLTDSDSSDVNSSTAFSSSNLLLSNDFYAYQHSGGSIDLKVIYSTASPGGADLDLYLLKNDFAFGDESDILGASEMNISNPTTQITESIFLPSLAAGTYMIDVKLFTGNGSPRNYGGFMQPATYRIYINNTEYCPVF